MPANAGWYEIVEGETHCGCGHPFAEHFVVDPFVTEWYFSSITTAGTAAGNSEGIAAT
jgi:hypothetical protein